MSVTYEWDIEEHDPEEGGDILDHNHARKLSEYRARQFEEINGVEFCLALVWNRLDQNNHLFRSWAYAEWADESWHLPKQFDNGTNVPKRFHDELKARQ